MQRRVERLKRKTGALILIALFFLPAALTILHPAFAAGDYFLENWNENFEQGTHENTENINNQLRLAPENTSGRFTSQALDAGENVRWDNIVWMGSEPTAFVQENDNVIFEDNISNSTIENNIDRLKSSDGSYERIEENSDNQLLVEHWIGPVSKGYDNYTVVIEGYTSGENVGVYILENQNGTWGWRLIENLTSTERTLYFEIRGENIDNYLRDGENIKLKYEDWVGGTDDSQPADNLFLDFVIVMENVTYTSDVELQVRVSSDGTTWTDNLGPDGTSSTSFGTPSITVNLENIPIGRYIQYVVYFSSENGALLSGANGPIVDNVLINFTRPTRLIRPADGENTNDNTPTFSWENRAPNALNYRLVIDNDPNFADGENTYDNANILGKENFIEIENQLPDGLWYWKVQVKSSGGWGPWSEVRCFRVDTLAPLAPVNIQISPSGWTTTGSFTISWTDPDDNAAIRKAYYKVDAAPTSPTDGTLVEVATGEITSLTLTITEDGTHTIYVWLQDNAGNVDHNNRASVTAYFDNSPPAKPTISSTTHAEGAVSGNASPSFSWEAVGGPSPVTYYYMLYPYETDWQTTTSTSVSYSGVPDGEYTFKLKAADTGGESGVDQYSIIIDTVPSTIELSGVAATAKETGTGWTLTTTQQTFTLSGRVEPGSQVTINGTAVSVAGDGTFSKTYTLSPGQTVFRIRVIDAAGNITEKTLTVNYSGVAPTVAGPSAVEPLMLVAALVVLIVVIVGVVFRFTRRK